MSQAIKIAVREGDTITHRVGRVLVVLTCVRPGASYRVAVQYGSTGVEVPELTANYADETLARVAARRACRAFAGGQTVDAILRPRRDAVWLVAA